MNTYELIRQNDLYKKIVIKQILRGNLVIRDIDKELRIQSPSFYIAALKVNRNNCKSYCDTLQLLTTDIAICKNLNLKQLLVDIYHSNYNQLKDLFPNARALPYFNYIAEQLINSDEQLRLSFEFEKFS